MSLQLGLHPTQVLGHITGEACGFLLRRGDSQGSGREGRAASLGWIPARKNPFLPLSSHLDVREGFCQISVNFEGDLGILELLTSVLGQLPQFHPGSPAPGSGRPSRKSAFTQLQICLLASLTEPDLLLSRRIQDAPKLPFLTPSPASGPASSLLPWSLSFQLYSEFRLLLLSHPAHNWFLGFVAPLLSLCSSLSKSIRLQTLKGRAGPIPHLLCKLSLSPQAPARPRSVLRVMALP